MCLASCLLSEMGIATGWFENSSSPRYALSTLQSWFSGRGWGQQLFSFQSPAVHWIARTSSLNCLSGKILTKPLIHWIASPLFTENPIFCCWPFSRADFGKEFPSRTLWRGPSWNCPSPSSVLCPLLYRTERYSRGRAGRKGAQKRGGRGVASKGGKKEKRTRENKSVYANTATPDSKLNTPELGPEKTNKQANT